MPNCAARRAITFLKLIGFLPVPSAPISMRDALLNPHASEKERHKPPLEKDKVQRRMFVLNPDKEHQ